MKLRTEIERKPMHQLIALGDGLMFVGSCFTDHMGDWMKEMWLPVCCNPWGVLFNPESIALSLKRLNLYTVLRDRMVHNGEMYSQDFPLVERNGKYYSFNHHGKFAGTDPKQVQQQLLKAEEEASIAWKRTKHVIVTLGSAWVYERRGKVVANCHKFPASEFNRRMLSVSEIVDQWKRTIAACNGKHFIFTVSPIRHVADGLHENQLSKATLLLAVEELVQFYKDTENVDYLPTYELFMDDLRDYRFYADDLVHPGSLGIEMVKELFADCCFTKEMRQYVSVAQPIVKALSHRPFDADSPQYKEFIQQQLLLKHKLIEKYENRR